jgi:protein SERAC1
LISKNDEQPHIRDIYDSTIGIEFLGTPHRGAILANWAALLGRYTSMVKKSNQDIINLLKPQSEVHDRINQDFHKILSLQGQRKRPLRIVCFFEELPILGIGEVSQ